MSVPSSSSSLLTSGIVNVPLHNDGTSSCMGTESVNWLTLMSNFFTRSASGEYHVGDLNNTGRARCTDLNNGLRVVVVGKGASGTHDDGPSFTDDLSASWDLDGAADDVCSCIEEDDLATSILQDDISDRTLCTCAEHLHT